MWKSFRIVISSKGSSFLHQKIKKKSLKEIAADCNSIFASGTPIWYISLVISKWKVSQHSSESICKCDVLVNTHKQPSLNLAFFSPQSTHAHINLKTPEEMQVLMRGRNGERQSSCPWPSPPSGALCSAVSAFFTLKHMVTGQQG